MPAADLDRDRLRGFFTDQQENWQDVSRQWIEFRKQDQSRLGGTSPLDASTRLQPDNRRSGTGQSYEDPPYCVSWLRESTGTMRLHGDHRYH
jgi:hypothetical protein